MTAIIVPGNNRLDAIQGINTQIRLNREKPGEFTIVANFKGKSISVVMLPENPRKLEITMVGIKQANETDTIDRIRAMNIPIHSATNEGRFLVRPPQPQVVERVIIVERREVPRQMVLPAPRIPVRPPVVVQAPQGFRARVPVAPRNPHGGGGDRIVIGEGRKRERSDSPDPRGPRREPRMMVRR